MNVKNKYLVLAKFFSAVWLLNGAINIFVYPFIDNNTYMMILQGLLFFTSLFFLFIHRKKNNLPILPFLHGDDEVKNARNRRAIKFGCIAVIIIFLCVLLLILLGV